jgi:cytochrome P450
LHCRKQLLNQIEQIIRQRQQSSDPGQDALGLLLQARDEQGNRLSLEELKDQILLLLFAGHETLTSALASTCLLLAQHPDSLATVRAEQQQLNRQSPWTMEDLKQMTYLEQVLKEVMRLIPPVGGGVRECLGREFAKLEMKLFTALLVRDYQWELLPEQNLDMVAVPTPHPRDGLRVKFSRR